MTNPITWAVNQIKAYQWATEFERTPTEHLGVLIVKNFRGAYYCVGVDEVRVRTLEVLKALPRDGAYPPVLALIESIEGPSHGNA